MTELARRRFQDHFSRVEISSSTVDNSVSVHPIWKGVDRPNVGGWCVTRSRRGWNLASRLACAIESGAAFTDVQYLVDINGRTYIHASSNILGRTLNADLKRIGY